MSAAKEWESKQCDKPCPTGDDGSDISCGACEGLRLDGFRAGVRWVYEMFEKNMKNADPLFDVYAEIKKELIGD